MVARAEARYVRVSPKKVRPVIALIKGDSVQTALTKLGVVHKKGASLILKVVKSALANAKQKGHPEQSLYISRIIANSGPMLKRYRAASFGRATTIRKRTSHILVELDTTQKIIQSVKPETKTKAETKAKAKAKTKAKTR